MKIPAVFWCVFSTGTFKLIKSRLKEAAFDPHRTSDAVFYFDAQRDQYQILTPDVYARIVSGSIRY